ncbi:alpha/beta hydrolase [Brevundimonas sp. 2R-24]|uniref:Alpha/beta hydrolase n=1 Tax=Peiella sedimenti TaxID=3061083 RepID=A0ABT8SQB1_9CAUL|nr:alpha/beta hydrolase [Caulobacteraceae bacterium XZ-24]
MRRRAVEANGLTFSVLEAGEGPLVLLLHGFPELAISWRAQIEALAEAGYRAVAPDMRGYGLSAAPEDRDAYSILNLVGDVVGLANACGAETCTVVGHDWGAAVAWHCALLRPDLFTKVAGLSVPFQPRRAAGPPTKIMAALSKRAGLGDLYIQRFQAPDAHAPFDADPEAALRKCFYGYDGATPPEARSTGFVPEGLALLDTIPDEAPRPPWMSADHLAEYADAFGRTGFRPAFDWYRNIDRNWALTSAFQDKRIEVPALFLAGEADPVRLYAQGAEAELDQWVPNLRGKVIVPGAGHWLQQERPDEVNAALLDFLKRA